MLAFNERYRSRCRAASFEYPQSESGRCRSNSERHRILQIRPPMPLASTGSRSPRRVRQRWRGWSRRRSQGLEQICTISGHPKAKTKCMTPGQRQTGPCICFQIWITRRVRGDGLDVELGLIWPLRQSPCQPRRAPAAPGSLASKPGFPALWSLEAFPDCLLPPISSPRCLLLGVQTHCLLTGLKIVSFS